MNRVSKLYTICSIALGAIIFLILFPKVVDFYHDRNVYESDTLQKEPEVVEVVEEPVQIKIVGDMMFDRYVRKSIEKNGFEYIFENLKDFFIESDIVLGNLEGTITTNKPVPLHPDAVRFTFDPSIASSLKKQGFTTLSLGNNHTRDFARKGYEDTQKYLQENNLLYFGDAFNKENLSVIQEVKDKKIGFVAYHELFKPDTTTVLEEIKRIRSEVDLLIVFPHWGVEYRQVHSPSQEAKAHAFIGAGADMIVGAHPHVVQDVEIYKNAPIFYSLGNFVFDQKQEGTDIGLVLDIDYFSNKLTFELVPVKLNKIQLHLLEGEEREEVLARIAKNSHGDNDFKELLKQGYFDIAL